MEISLSYGHGVVNDFNSAILRPFKQIIERGKTLGKIKYICLKEDGEHYLIGSLCATNNYLLFFPTGNRTQLMMPIDGSPKGFPAHIDHFSLDRRSGFLSSHVTFNEKYSKGLKGLNFKARRVKKDIILWFVMAARSLSDMERVPRTAILSFSRRPSEGTRIAKEITSSRKGVDDSECSGPSFKVSRPYLYNFEFFVSLNAKSPGDPLFPGVPPEMRLPNEQLTSREETIRIPGFPPTILVRIARLRGGINTPWSFVGGAQLTINDKQFD